MSTTKPSRPNRLQTTGPTTNPLFTDSISGALAGLVTGCFVAPAEFTKVYMQTTHPELRAWGSRHYLHGLAKSPLAFSPLFSLVCAIEFGMNSRFEKKYGVTTGIVASGITGATFLSAADQLLYRMKLGQTALTALANLWKVGPIALATGATPMFIREASFMATVLHLGPQAGSKLKKIISPNTEPNESDSKTWDTAGRYALLFGSTFLTHPCDSIARQMQVYTATHSKPASFLKATKNSLKEPAKLLKGVAPRLLLAPIGGAMIGSLYDNIKSHLEQRQASKGFNPDR